MSKKDLFHWSKQDFEEWCEQVEQSRLSYWFPKIPKNILMPNTLIVETKCDLRTLPYGEQPKDYEKFLAILGSACKSIGLPCFLRTDLTSDKHSWNASCYLKELQSLPDYIFKLCETSAMANIATDGWPVDVWVVREFLTLHSTFKAFNEMPINKERRYFVRDGKVVCHHPYWPEEAFENQKNLHDNWQSLLFDLNKETDEEIEYLTIQTELVGSVLCGYWSCDWAYTETGKWVLIDMAAGEDSYHWQGCIRGQAEAV